MKIEVGRLHTRDKGNVDGRATEKRLIYSQYVAGFLQPSTCPSLMVICLDALKMKSATVAVGEKGINKENAITFVCQ